MLATIVLSTLPLLIAPMSPISSNDLREGPIPRAAATAGIGRLSPAIEPTSTGGDLVALVPRGEEEATVIALTSILCPLSRKYAPLLGRMSNEGSRNGIRWIFLDVTGSDTPAEFDAFASRHGFVGDRIHDEGLRIAKALGATSTAEAIVLDRTGSIRYRGCVDDRYGLGYALDAPRITPLADAISAVRSGRPILLEATTAPGCELPGGDGLAGEHTPTYHGSISRILQANCLECHRSGGAGPFPLETYEEVTANAGMIKRVLTRATMPPWFAGRDADHDHGAFANDRSLPSRDIDEVVSWIDGGRPMGDPARAPLPRSYPSRWSIEEPDRVVRLPEPVQIKAEGRMPYVNIVVDIGFEEDTWIRGWEVLPTNRSVVHHALLFLDSPTIQRRPGATEGFLGAYVPGNGMDVYPEGYAKKIPAGSRLHFQIHYTPNGTACTEQMAMGLLVSEEPPVHEIHTIGIADTRLRIPAGAEAHEEGTVLEIPADMRVLSITPHMHIRGAAFKCSVEDPTGELSTLLDVPHYDFNWQIRYQYADPPLLSEGSRIQISGTFDNSSTNPANPDPTQKVRWGQQTDDEMLIGYLEYWIPGNVPDARNALPDASDEQNFTERARRMLEKWDANKDGRVSREEIPANRQLQFKLVDLDGDGFVDEREFVKAARLLTR